MQINLTKCSTSTSVALASISGSMNRKSCDFLDFTGLSDSATYVELHDQFYDFQTDFIFRTFFNSIPDGR